MLPQLVDEFASRWESGDTRPSLEQFLERVEKADRLELFESLLVREVQIRLALGERPRPEEYAERFPDFVEVIQRCFGEETIERSLESTANWEQGIGSPELRKSDAAENDIRLDGYNVIRRIASGGMGVVLLARDERLGRLVAVKMIKGGGFADHEQVERFHHEARAVAALHHPHIISIYEIGERDGQHFFSMAYVAGPSLAEYLRDGPVDGAPAARLVRTVARAIAYAHRQKVIHRDLKPANILLARKTDTSLSSNDTSARLGHEGEQREQLDNFEPVVTDFGLAKRPQGQSGMTHTGQILGTPSFMPPEQALGQADVGSSADIYSLGAVLYAMLTGRPPFQSAQVLETLRLVTDSEPLPPRQLVPTVDRDLETICLKCLEKDPQRRYATADDLAADLDRYLSGQPIHARQVSALERTWRWARRRPAVAVLLLMLVLLAVAGPWVAAVQMRLRATAEQNRRAAERNGARYKREWERANRAVVEARTQRQRAEENYKRALETSLAIAAERGEWENVIRIVDESRDRFPDSSIKLQLLKIKALNGLNQIEATKQLAESLYQNIDNAKPDEVGPIKLWRAEVNALQGSIAQSKRWFQEAIDAGLPRAEELYARALLAETTPEAIDLLQQAVQSDPFHQRAYALLATDLALLGRRAEAMEVVRTGRRLFPQDRNFPLAWLLVAFCENDGRQMAEALDVLREQMPKDTVQQFESLLQTLGQYRPLLKNWDVGDISLRERLGIARGIWQALSLWRSVGSHQTTLGSIRQSPTVIAAYAPILELFSPTQLPQVIAGRADIAGRLEQSLRHHPDGWLFFFSGLLATMNDHPLEAIDKFEQAVERPQLLAETKREAQFGLVMAHMIAAVEIGHAEEHFVKGARAARLYVTSGEIPRHRAGYLILMARRGGDFNLAREVATRMHQRDNADANWLIELAKIAHDERNWIEVVRYAEDALERAPDSEEAEKLLKEAQAATLALTADWQQNRARQ